MAAKRELQNTAQVMKELPDTAQERKELPVYEAESKELPAVGKMENIVMIGGKPIEIKPTLLKYQRNRTAEFYRFLKVYPLCDIMAMDSKTFGDGRDGDKATMDWLIAVTDDEELIRENYDEMDTETIEKLISAYERVNHINEKDLLRKNMEAMRKEG